MSKRDKSKNIADYDKELKALRAKSIAVVKENDVLIDKLDKFASAANVDPDQQIMLTENSRFLLSLIEALSDY